ncbi:MAG TPA: arginase, partial [Flavobacterium sp.]
MEKLIPFTLNDLAKITDHRIGEIKFGEKMLIVPKGANAAEYLQKSKADYVLLGIPEDIGVRANFGRAGTATAWESAIRSISNLQHNRFGKGSCLLVLGEIDIGREMKEADTLDYRNQDDRKQLYTLVEKVDKIVSHFIALIVRAGKTPIVIGGGHNN